MTVLFILLSAVLLLSTLGVVALKNPIHCALCLVANLLLVAVCFAMLEAHFLAAVQVIVYAGAIMVLVLFMLMLLNIKVERRSGFEISLVIFALVLGVGFLAGLVPYLKDAFGGFPLGQGSAASGQVSGAVGSVKAMGLLLFEDYLFLFQASAVVLMTAIVGAIMIARAKQR